MNCNESKSYSKLINSHNRKKIFAIAGGVVAVICIVIGVILFITLNKEIENPFIDKLVIEAGDNFGIDDFLKDKAAKPEDIKFITDITAVDVKKVGTYELELGVEDEKFKAALEIQDTVAPKGEVRDIQTELGIVPDVSECVVSATDITSVTSYFKNEPDVSKDGMISAVVVFEDEGGNTSEYTVNIDVVGDRIAPVIEGLSDIKIQEGETIAYKTNLVVTDNEDTDPKVSIDNGAVDTSKPGTYPVTYTATDVSGNSSSVTINVIVEKKPEPPVENNGSTGNTQVTEESVRSKARNVLAKITNDSMDQLDKTFAIYCWIVRNIAYTEYSNHSDWVAAADRGFSKNSGDCYVFYAVARVLLEEAGIENKSVIKTDTTHAAHFWNLVNVGTGWYHFDSTPYKGSDDKLFMVTDEELEAFSQLKLQSYGYLTHVYDESAYPERATESIQSMVDYANKKLIR